MSYATQVILWAIVWGLLGLAAREYFAQEQERRDHTR